MKTIFAVMAFSAIAANLAAVEISDKLLNTGFRPGRKDNGPVDTIVIHYASDVAAHPNEPFSVDSVIKLFTANNVSAHYLVDREGKIFRLVLEGDTAYHAGIGSWLGRTNTLNQYSIGIELLGIGSAFEMRSMLGMTQDDYEKLPSENLGFTRKQYTALKALVADIESRHPKLAHDRKHIIGHDEYAPGRKFDPGTNFRWSEIGL